MRRSSVSKHRKPPPIASRDPRSAIRVPWSLHAWTETERLRDRDESTRAKAASDFAP
jgi:hypothetical protein